MDAFTYYLSMNHKRFFLLFTIVVLAMASVSYAQTKPNFTGTWKLNVAKSDEQDDGPQSLVATVDHKDPVFTYTVKGTAGGQEINETATLRTDGTPTKGPNDITFVCHWDGPTLVLTGTAPDQSPVFEAHLSLAADGKSISRTVIRMNGNQQQTRHEIYDKM